MILWHINPCWLFKAKSSLYIYFKYIWFSWVGFYGISIFTNSSARAGYDTRSVFKAEFNSLNSEFSFSLTSCLTTAEEPSLPYYLPIAGVIIIGFISFPRVLVQCEMQSVLSRIWTRIAVSISHDDNHYTTGTSTYNGISTIVGYLMPNPLCTYILNI